MRTFIQVLLIAVVLGYPIFWMYNHALEVNQGTVEAEGATGTLMASQQEQQKQLDCFYKPQSVGCKK